jgi:hypothetical protein
MKKPPFEVRFTIGHLPGKPRKPTIHEVLKKQLGREPTHNELVAEVKRILGGVTQDMADKGKLPHQRKGRYRR